MTTTAICLKRRRSEFGSSLELPAAADVVYVGRAMYQGGWRLPGSPYANPFRAQTAASTGNGRTGEQARVEVLWSNRPLGAQGVLDFEAGAP